MKYLYLILVFFISLLSSSCVNKKKKQQSNVIVVTIEPLKFFTERIVGDKYNIVSMVPQGGNPETYEPSASQMIELSRCKLFIEIGNIGFERVWMDKLQANAPKVVFVNASKGISMMIDKDGKTDPHTWMSTKNAILIARNIYNSITKIDGKNGSYYKKNLKKLIEEINHIDKETTDILKDKRSTAFLIYHPILTYFARDYGLTQISMEYEGREASANKIQEIISVAKKRHAKVFFIQKEFDNRNVNAIAKITGARIVEINPLGYHWNKEMLNVAKCLK